MSYLQGDKRNSVQDDFHALRPTLNSPVQAPSKPTPLSVPVPPSSLALPPPPSPPPPSKWRPEPGAKVVHVIEQRSSDDKLISTKYVSKLESLASAEKQAGGLAFEVVRTVETTKNPTGMDWRAWSARAAPFGNVSESRPYQHPPILLPHIPPPREATRHLRIHSRSIINALQSVVNYYPYRAIIGEPLEIYEPFAILVHHWDALASFRELFDPRNVAEDTTHCRLNDTFEDLGYLLEFLETEMGEKVRAEQARWAEPVPKASFEMLWLLLKPGTDVYFDNGDGTKSAAVISYVTTFGDTKQHRKYNVKFWQMHGAGFDVQPYEHQRTYLRFHGEKPITDLYIFPKQYLTNHDDLNQSLIKQGQLYCSLLAKKCMYFDGQGEAIPGQEFTGSSPTRRAIPPRAYKGNVMLDPERQDIIKKIAVLEPNRPEYVEAMDLKASGLRFCICGRCSKTESELTRPAKFAGYQKVLLSHGEGLTSHQFALCPRLVWAFVLDIREWRLLRLDGFSDARWNSTLIDSLVIKPNYKLMLLNLCRMFVQHRSTNSSDRQSTTLSTDPSITPWAADFVENKGKGLIFLLHGRPGVGKTYTAECIADHVQRPLLSISCADIGIQPGLVEQSLRHWLDLGRRWDAIVLLDEADIYMEYRQIHDLARNSLVASFLQAIEYYDGVLFLTTNRIGTFDEAFLSRINALYYGDFSDDDRKRVWNNYFDKLEHEREDIYVPESTRDYVTNENVKALRWNGREIRNAFQVAVNLAQAEGIRDSKGRIVVKRHHIEVTVDLSSDFKDYMKSVRKKDESERALLVGNRDDSYKVALDTSGVESYI